MILATTALDAFWGRGDELALLGPWCVRGRRDPRLEGRRWRMLPNVWDDRARLRESAAYCTQTYAVMIGRLAERLDALHGTSHGERYWDILAGSWMTFHVHQLYDRWTQIRAARTLHPDAACVALDPRDFRVPYDAEDFLRLFHTDHYNLQLYSQALVFEGAGVRVQRDTVPPPPPPDAARERGASRMVRDAVRDSLRLVSDRAVRLGLASIATDELYPSGSLLWRIVRACGLRALPIRPPDAKRLRAVPVQDARRGGLRGLRADDDFQRLLVSTLPYALPTSYLEGYAALRALCAGPYRRTPKTVFAGVSLYYDEGMKFVVAEWVARGARLLGFQHGGQYGTAAFSLSEEHERRISDRYYTWGWSSVAGDPKLGDLPVPKYSKIAGERPFPLNDRASDILVVCGEGLKNAHHLFPTPMGTQWERYIAQRERFLEALLGVHAAARIRLSPQDYGWDQRGRLLERFPGIRLDDNTIPFPRSADSARLVVTDHPGTALLELLATNRPSIHFWDRTLWELRPEAEPAFDLLRRVGIVHDTPEAAAAHAVRIHGDVRSWWLSPEVQEARRAFTALYARTSETWLDAWKLAILGL